MILLISIEIMDNLQKKQPQLSTAEIKIEDEGLKFVPNHPVALMSDSKNKKILYIDFVLVIIVDR